jgi:hypothetical protein
MDVLILKAFWRSKGTVALSSFARNVLLFSIDYLKRVVSCWFCFMEWPGCGSSQSAGG